MRVVTVPASFDHRGVDGLLDRSHAQSDERVLFNAHRVRWIDPSGMLALLVAGRDQALRGGKPILKLPENADVVSYLRRMNFLKEADSVFELAGRTAGRTSFAKSDALLEVTRIDSHHHVRALVGKIQSRAGDILSGRLGLPGTAVIPFSIVLSEVCQNVVEHAGPGQVGWVAVQVYNWAQRLGRYAAVISVMDCGIGFRRSLERRHGADHGGAWDDTAALRAAVFRGLSRFAETGRGQGLREVRRQVLRWRGAMSVRSGGSRIALGGAPWSEQPSLVSKLRPFPGAQLVIIIPAAEEDGRQ